ncbi:SubName: Full=Uncharacterized protein {ECO:0000313/EMBL:CCA71066.1} [Serendipita indica DSM 11827]|uniref:Uncharacterized protein n=1 Tax=Serendipita indica (strain DSM 11827) TaxID=1109443 RepID=G4TID9_SERID|nr:SubName: Full=Uncharacterized protein {ECO:0000313/EMBL:CCA71066.1} [Serendipita indica DSM 11827]CCA71066.1 hypothetical protein PIIN_05001 [Serendipita indica DSM 11827]
MYGWRPFTLILLATVYATGACAQTTTTSPRTSTTSTSTGLAILFTFTPGSGNSTSATATNGTSTRTSTRASNVTAAADTNAIDPSTAIPSEFPSNGALPMLAVTTSQLVTAAGLLGLVALNA